MATQDTRGSARSGIVGLKEVIKREVEASTKLQQRIDQLRRDIAEGKLPSGKKIDLMENSNKEMTKDLVHRIEQIEGQGELTGTDREMLQMLTEGLSVCDQQAMRLAELRDVDIEARGERHREFLTPETETAMVRKNMIEKPKTASRTKMLARTQSAPSRFWEKPHIEPAELIQSVHPEVEEAESSDGSLFNDTESDGSWEDAEPDSTSWPLLYRILGIDPKTDNEVFKVAAEKAMMKLGANHDPARIPNDPDAPRRWAAVIKAYETLTDPERKRFYDMHGKEPAGLKDFDLSTLSIKA